MSTAIDTKPHRSPTQLDMYSRCAEAFRRRYIEGEVIPPGIAAMKGTSLHRGAQTNFVQKIESHEDLSASDIIDASVAAFESQAADSYSLSPEEAGRGAKIVIGEAKDDVAALATVHATKQAPEYQPVFVEQRVRIHLPQASHDLLGVIDLADDKDRVVDFKTSGKKKSQADADTSTQLTVYAIAFRSLTGKYPSELRLDTLVQTKTKTERDFVTTTRDLDDVTALANRLTSINAAIEAGIFPPTTPDNWMCSPKWCGYFATCKYVKNRLTQGT